MTEVLSPATAPRSDTSLPPQPGVIKRWFKNLKIGQKLFLTYGILIGFLMIFCTVTLFNLFSLVNEGNPAQKLSDSLVTLETIMVKDQSEFLANDIHDISTNFYTTGTDSDIIDWQNKYEAFLAQEKEMEALEQRMGISQSIDHKKIASSMQEYHDTFLQILDTQKKLGFYTFGEEGVFRQAAVNLEQSLSDPKQLTLLLEARRYEKDFFLRNDLSYLSTYDSYVTELQKTLPVGSTQAKYLQEYSDSFHKAVQLQQEIGLHDDEGMLLKEQQAIAVLEPLLIARENTIDHAAQQKILFIIGSTVVLAVGFILLGILLAVRVSKTIATRINQITHHANIMARGNTSETLTVSSKDEVGQLAEALNILTNNLLQNQKEAEAKNQELITNNDQLSLGKKATLNLLEDLEASKRKIESEKVKDEAILSSIGDGVIVTDNAGTILFANQSSQDLIGSNFSEMQNKRWALEIPVAVDEMGNPLVQDKIALYEALQQGKKVSYSTIYQIKEGRKMAAAVTASPIILEGKTVGGIVVFRDVTKEHEVDRMKTEFISLASHQLRTPLTAMKWFSEMLLSGDGGPLNKEQTEFVSNINASNERMIDLVNSLLNISRIESGRLIVEPVPTSLNELAQQVLSELKPRMDAKKQRLIFSAHDNLEKINVDPRLISQVFSNLLTNSIKYTPEGGEISVFISKKNDAIVSQVSDSGYGIPKEEQSKIFQKFYRGTNIIPIETDGTGLGLYLIKAIIESSGGKIWFDSEVGKGTSFYFSLPMTGMIAKKGEVRIGQ